MWWMPWSEKFVLYSHDSIISPVLKNELLTNLYFWDTVYFPYYKTCHCASVEISNALIQPYEYTLPDYLNIIFEEAEHHYNDGKYPLALAKVESIIAFVWLDEYEDMKYKAIMFKAKCLLEYNAYNECYALLFSIETKYDQFSRADKHSFSEVMGTVCMHLNMPYKTISYFKKIIDSTYDNKYYFGHEKYVRLLLQYIDILFNKIWTTNWIAHHLKEAGKFLQEIHNVEVKEELKLKIYELSNMLKKHSSKE